MGTRFLRCLANAQEPFVRATRSYVIRIYRRDAQSIDGLIEDVQTSRTTAFHSLDELCELLRRGRALPRRPGREAGTAASRPDPPSE
jgi:hypothetical protein